MRRIIRSAVAAASALFLLGACGGNGDQGTYGDGLGTGENACLYGCTLTQGYWKTHSKYGPAPYDDAWQFFEDGPLEDAQDGIYKRTVPCYDVLGLTWYEQFWAAPRGDPWLILAHQYAAAWLNYYNGASIELIHDELDVEARDLLYGYCPGDPEFDAKRGDFLRLAERLEEYNSGLVGPPHCSDE